MKILRKNDLCLGCKICQLMCSFHHKGVFSTAFSSIKMSKNNQTARIRWAIDSTCDTCKGEESPLCVGYCPYNALKEVR